MIRDIKLTSVPDKDQLIISYLKEQRALDNKFKAIDVGGSVGGYTYPYVDAIMDINPPTDDGHIKHFKANLNMPDDWLTILEYVKENDKFDFVVCSHTLEDISNPQYVCTMLSKIAKSGYIAVPSKYFEFSKMDSTVERRQLRGCIHHRWIFNFIEGKFTGFPKVTFVEVDPFFLALEKEDKNLWNLGFFWEDDVQLHIINGDYLGPTVQNVIWMYRQKLFNDDLDKQYRLINDILF